LLCAYYIYSIITDCSLCIRKYLHYKTQCPICSEETFEKDLRKNKILDEIIQQYLNIKEQFEKKSHTEETPTTKGKNSSPAYCLNNHEYKKKRITNCFSHKALSKTLNDSMLGVISLTPTTPCGQKNHQQDISTPSTSTEARIPLMFTPKSRKGFRNEENCEIVACPVCKVNVSQNNINKHLDDCLKRKNANNQPQRYTILNCYYYLFNFLQKKYVNNLILLDNIFICILIYL